MFDIPQQIQYLIGGQIVFKHHRNVYNLFSSSTLRHTYECYVDNMKLSK